MPFSGLIEPVVHPNVLWCGPSLGSVEKGTERRRGGAPRRARGENVEESRIRLVQQTMREALFVAIAAAGSWLFLNHELLYLRDGFRLATRPVEAYLITTLVTYLFIRSVVALASIRVPRPHAGPGVCPECGQPLPAGTPGGRTRLRVARSPTADEVAVPNAFRKAIADSPSALDRPNREVRYRVPGLVGRADNVPLDVIHIEVSDVPVPSKDDLRDPRRQRGP